MGIETEERRQSDHQRFRWRLHLGGTLSEMGLRYARITKRTALKIYTFELQLRERIWILRKSKSW